MCNNFGSCTSVTRFNSSEDILSIFLASFFDAGSNPFFKFLFFFGSFLTAAESSIAAAIFPNTAFSIFAGFLMCITPDLSSGVKLFWTIFIPI
ncbi:ORF265 [White spot syndrome virus]|uniref:ORF265 n=1 Tax=White spot syndrome virus TaxID=342409 RepID=A0A2D3I5N0_9VIRU|nr:ORF265 [White spot syndrome virus]